MKKLTDNELITLISTEEMIKNNDAIKMLYKDKEGYIVGYNYKEGFDILVTTNDNIIRMIKSEEIKPILRTIDQLTDNEREEFKKLKYVESNNKYKIPFYNGVKSMWYIKKGFDIFQWIDLGIAEKRII